MNNLPLVSIVEGVRNLDTHVQHFPDRQQVIGICVVFETFALRIVHHDVFEIVFYSGFVDGHDIRMAETGGRLRFTPEPLLRFLQCFSLKLVGQ